MSETSIARRHLVGALAAAGATGLATAAHAAPRDLAMADFAKDTEVACLYHCDFGQDARYGAMLRNINNHLSVYEFDPFKAKIVIVAHSAGIKYHLKTLAGTPWAQDPAIDPEFDGRMAGLGRYGVEVYLCRITFETNKIDPALAKDAPYLRFVPSGVAAVAALQAKGFSYLKVG